MVIAAVAATPVDTVLAVVRIAAAAGMDAADPLLDMFLVTERVLGVGILAGRAGKVAVMVGSRAAAAAVKLRQGSSCRVFQP